MKFINLSKNKVAVVSDKDYNRVKKHKWSFAKRHGNEYAINNDILLHRFILGCAKGDGRIIDHKNGDGLNCMRGNLREATKLLNNRNKKANKKTSIYKGVYLTKKKNRWATCINVKYKKIYLGSFPNTPSGELLAARTYDRAAKLYYGKFGNLNFPEHENKLIKRATKFRLKKENEISKRYEILKKKNNILFKKKGIIPLTQGKFAIISPQDYDLLNKWKWYAQKGTHTYYAVRRNGKKKAHMHRIILGLKDDDKRVGEHKDHNGLNNKRSNLRIATVQQNLWNKKSQKNSSSKYRGVALFKNKTHNGKTYFYWYAFLNVKGRSIHLGSFKTEKEAAIAYDNASKKYRNKWASLNFK